MKFLNFMLVLVLSITLIGCGTNFNDVQIAKIKYDQTRVESMERIARDQEVTKQALGTSAFAKVNNPDEGAGLKIATDDQGRITSVFISENVMRGGSIADKFPADAPNLIASSSGYQPQESTLAKNTFGFLTNLAKFGLYGYGINQIAGAVGDKTTTYTAGGDQAVNTGMNGVAGVTNTPVTDSYNDFSDNSDNRIDDNADNRLDYNNDNRTDFDKPNDVVIVEPATPIVVQPSYPPVVDPIP